MQSTEKSGDYCVWGPDGIAYGPLPLDTLKSWVRGNRVSASSWVFSGREDQWKPAREWPELNSALTDIERGADPEEVISQLEASGPPAFDDE